MNDEELWERFKNRSLSHDEWTHRAHVRIAYLHLKRYPFDEALNCLRQDIKGLNAVHQVPESPMRGYNETVTVAFLTLVDCMMQVYPESQDSEEFCDSQPQLMNPRVLRLYYTLERRMHPDAKTQFVAPDLAPLPQTPRA